ncbi:transposase [Aquabacterium sp. A7-Y]|uniref:transposase n=1 Tax=Aquabacterium sp. A7-Y TaxID=1349605 RepID=UPI00223CE3ED|nr:transposase [Aquabacterium sp. A7-Y]MCW7539053.1 transposase [Aquabacterium sp. A7-Y]
MARLPRLVLPGLPHHLVQQGHHRQTVFETDEDYRTYLAALREAALTCRVAVHAYALLPDGVQLLATPADASGLSRMMQTVGRRYVGWHNRVRGRSGTLWEGRFRASVLDPQEFLLPVMVYVDTASQRAEAGVDPAAWVWSSYGHHVGQRSDAFLAAHALYWTLGNTPFDREARYRGLVEHGLSQQQVRQIEDASWKGWALGSGAFIERIGQLVDRPLAPRPRGRPKKIHSVPV